MGRRTGETRVEGMQEYIAKEYCRRCGMEVYPFSKKYSVSTGETFCVRCAERADREYLIKNSCSVCRKLLKADEVKLVMPSKIYGNTTLPLVNRLMCTSCYKRVGVRTMDRGSFRHTISRVQANIRRSLVKRAIKQYA